jgi:hypothetical protein
MEELEYMTEEQDYSGYETDEYKEIDSYDAYESIL